ncbi:hypothetical protein [Herpetosiphon giganteus]|uniref:hypothetical protein n=1 Tax=Herpetosiphon giganteus TaxID=2029754 RepID=UPI001956299E|nr:hypothetical protein [Herpetosiphon giganteus]MBM7845586.1 hypothetical protein [Herpetosiphon giganteus]
MRTEELMTLDKTLSRMNSELMLILFINEQFFLDHSDAINANHDKLTDTIFMNNKYNKKFNERNSRFFNISESSISIIFRSFYSYIFEAYKIYIENILYRSRDILKSSLVQKNKEFELDFLFRVLGSDKESHMLTDEVDTLDYFRLRRNKIIHQSGEIQRELKDIIEKKGLLLNKFWNNNKVVLKDLDFSSLSVTKLSELEIIDVIRIIRRICSKIDEAVLSRIPRDVIIQYVLTDFKKDHIDKIKKLKQSEKRIKGMFCRILEQKFNLVITEHELSGLDFTLPESDKKTT